MPKCVFTGMRDGCKMAAEAAQAFVLDTEDGTAMSLVMTYQDAQQEVQEGLAAVLLLSQLAVREAGAEGVGANDVVQLRVLEVALAGGRLHAVRRLELCLCPQLQRSPSSSVYALNAVGWEWRA